MGEKLHISIVQFAPALGMPQYNLEKIDHFLSEIPGTDLVILPELANSGYHFQSREQAFNLSEEVRHSSFLKFLIEKARQKNCSIVSGMNERENDSLYNSSILVDAEGVKGRYRKLHLFMNEKSFFEPGNEGLPLFEVKGVKTGMLICFDYLFPEIWRIMALKGAQLICHPSNLVTPFGEKVIPVQAIMNRFFIATANRVGNDRELFFRGRSLIAGTEGQILSQAPEDKECVIKASINPIDANNKMITEKNHVLHDRRPEMYKGLI